MIDRGSIDEQVTEFHVVLEMFARLNKVADKFSLSCLHDAAGWDEFVTEMQKQVLKNKIIV